MTDNESEGVVLDVNQRGLDGSPRSVMPYGLVVIIKTVKGIISLAIAFALINRMNKHEISNFFIILHFNN